MVIRYSFVLFLRENANYITTHSVVDAVSKSESGRERKRQPKVLYHRSTNRNAGENCCRTTFPTMLQPNQIIFPSYFMLVLHTKNGLSIWCWIDKTQEIGVCVCECVCCSTYVGVIRVVFVFVCIRRILIRIVKTFSRSFILLFKTTPNTCK